MGEKVTPDELNAVMEFDTVIRVNEDGTVDVLEDIIPPALVEGDLDSGLWTLLEGYTGQYGYRGPIMHEAEIIAGRLARDILATPGLYVSLVAYGMDHDCPFPEDCDYDVIGWAVAYKEESN